MNKALSHHNARLVLEDGTVFSGRSFGAEGESIGEAVFNTSMTGYQEVLTDPSYCGQMIAMTYPLIGNYGINEQDVESNKVQVSGFIVRELSRIVSNYRATTDLASYLRAQNTIGIEEIDTRALTRHLRDHGAMKAILSTQDKSVESLLKKVRNSTGIMGVDLVKKVTCEKAYYFSEHGKFRVAAIDCGTKLNIFRVMASLDCHVKVFPATVSRSEIEAFKPHGLFLSNGPGDPGAVTYLIDLIKDYLQGATLPIFGICLGHQILGIAYGAKYLKLKFGHHGGNQPVKNLKTSKVEITSQNHNFAIDPASLPADVEVTHIHLNDNTLSGMRHKTKPVFSVQYHPEASPGPNDSYYLFYEFIKSMTTYKSNHHV